MVDFVCIHILLMFMRVCKYVCYCYKNELKQLSEISVYGINAIFKVIIDDAEMLTSEMHDPYTRITVA